MTEHLAPESTQPPAWVRALQDRPEGHRVRGLGSLGCLAYAPDGARLATGGSLGVLLWDLGDRRVLARHAREVAPVVALAFASDGRRLAALGRDGGLAICELEGGATRVIQADELAGEDGAYRLQFAADDDAVLAIGDGVGWRIEGDERRALDDDALDELDPSQSADDGLQARSPAGDVTAEGDDYAGEIKFVGADGREVAPPLGRFIYASDSGVSLGAIDERAAWGTVVGFIGDGQNSSAWAQSWDLVNDRPGPVLCDDAALFCTSTAMVPGTTLVAIPWRDAGALLVDREGGDSLELADEAATQCVVVGDGGALIAGGSCDGDLVLWRREDGVRVARVRAHREQICGVAWRGDAIATTAQDGNVRLWSARALQTDAPAQSTAIAAVGGMLYQVAFSPDGSLCAVGGSGGEACVITAADGAVLQRLGGHAREVMALAFRPGSGELVTADLAGRVRVWAPRSGALLGELEYRGGDEVGVTSVAFSADGRTLVLAQVDGTLRCWDLPA